MPYRAVGTKVYVQRNGRWMLLREMRSEKAAEAHADALNINAHRPERKKPAKKGKK